MPAIFLSGRLTAPAMLRMLAGEAAPAVRPARLADHAFRPRLAGLGGLVACRGAMAEGVVAELDAASAARCGFLMAALDCAPRTVEARGAGAAVPARGFFRVGAAEREDGAPEAPDEGPAHAEEIAAEVLSQFGRCDAAEMPGRMHGIAARALARAWGRAGPAPAAGRRARSGPDVAALAIERPYAAFFGVEEHVLRHRRFDGAMSEPIHRTVLVSGDAVTVLPYDPRRDAVLVIEQFRAGPYARRDPLPWCLEAIAGRVEAGEPPEATARREAVEEAGLELGRFERIAGYYTTPGMAAEFVTSFLAEADLGGAGGVFGLADEHEDIRAVVLPLDDALGLVATGEVNNAPLMVSLLWLQAHCARLAAVWSSALDAAPRNG